MFKRLKEKISEEVRQSPLRLQTSVQSLGQYSPFKDNGPKKPSDSHSSSSAEGTSDKDGTDNLIDLQENSSSIMDNQESQQFSIADDDGTSSVATSPVPRAFENVDLSESVPAPIFSLEQTRSLSVSSNGSQTPLFPTYHSTPSNYSVQSDLESASEVEDTGLNLDLISKEQLYQAFVKAKSRYLRYKSRYGDVVRAYREQVNEKDKIKTILTESQDKALRRISELREQSLLDQKAKAHLEESFRVTLEEKDELLKVLQTQIRLLKSGNTTTNEDEADSPDPAPLIDVSSECDKDEEKTDSDPEQMTSKIKTYEETITKLKGLLKNCKDIIAKQRDAYIRLTAEKNEVNEKLNNASAQLKMMMEEKSEKDKEFMNELVQATTTIDKLKKTEEENSLSLAEAKHEMHKEMESKEQEIQSMKQQLKQVLAENEELVKTVEANTKTLKDVEDEKKLEILKAQQHLEETEIKIEEEKQSFVHQLSCAKSAAVRVMQEEAEKRLNELQEEHRASVRSVELEWHGKLDAKVQELEEKHKMICADLVELSAYSSLEKSCKTLQEELEEKNKKIEELLAEKLATNEQLQSHLRNNAEEISCSETSVDDLQRSGADDARIKDSLVKLVILLKEFQAWKIKMKDELMFFQLKNADSYSMLSTKMSELMLSHNADVQSVTREKEKKVQELECERQDLADQIRTARISYEKNATVHQDQLAELRDEVTRLNAETHGLRSKLEECQASLADSLSEIANLKTIISDADSAMLDVRAKHDALQVSLKEEKERLNASLKENFDLEQQLRESKDQVSRLNNAIRIADQSREVAETNLMQVSTTCSNLEASHAELREELDRVKTDSEETSSSLSKETAELKAQLADARKIAKVLEDEHLQATEQVKHFNRQVAECESEIRSLREQNGQLKDDMQKCQENADRQTEALTKELDERLRVTVKTLEEKVAELNQANVTEEQLRQELGVSREKVALLEETLLREREIGQQLILDRNSMIDERDRERDMLKVGHDAAVSEVVQAVENLNECLNGEISKSDALLQSMVSLRMELVSRDPADTNKSSDSTDRVVEETASASDEKQWQTSDRREPGGELLLTIQKVVLELNKLNGVTSRLKCEMDALRELFNSISSGHEHHVHELNLALENARAELSDVSARCEKYEEQIVELDHLNSVVENLENQGFALTTERDMLRTKLSECEHRSEQKAVDLQRSHRQQLVQLRDRTKQAMAELQMQLRDTKEDTKDSLSREQQEVRVHLKECIASVVSLAETMQHEKATEEATQQGFTKMQEEWNQQRQKLVGELEQLQVQLNQNRSELQTRTEENFSQQSLIEALSGQFDEVSRQLTSAALKQTELQEQVQRLEGELSVARLECERLTDFKTQLDKVQSELWSKSKDAGELEQSIEQLQLNCANLQTKLDTKEAEVFLLQESAVQSESQIFDLQEENRALHLANETNVNELRCCADNCRTLEEQLGASEVKYKDELEQSEKQHKDKTNELVQKFKSKLKKLRQEHEDKVLLLEERLSELNATNSELRHEVSVCCETIARLEQNLQDDIQNPKDEVLQSKNDDEPRRVSNSTRGQEEEPLFADENLQRSPAMVEQLKDTERQDYESRISLSLQQLKELQSSVLEKDEILAELRCRLQELNEEKQSMALQLQDLVKRMEESGTNSVSDERVAELQQQLVRAQEDHQSRLTELKKRAENKLAQIKKQMQLDAERSKEELLGQMARLEEQRLNDQQQSLRSLAEIKEAATTEHKEQILQLEKLLSELRLDYEGKIEKLQSALEKEKIDCANEKEKLLSELSMKNTQIDESLITAQVNHMDMVHRLNQLQVRYEEAEAEWQQREEELTASIASLRNKLDATQTPQNSSTEVPGTLDGDVEDNMQERLRREYQSHLKAKDEEHAAKIKQLAKEFSVMLSFKEEEGRQNVAQVIESSMNEENQLKREHLRQIQEMGTELQDKDKLLEAILEQKDSIIKEKDNQLASISKDFDDKILAMKNEHSSQLESLERRWKATVQKELKLQADKHEEEISGLSQEWEIERKFLPENDMNSVAEIEVMQEELVKHASLTSSVIESGSQSSDLLRRQIVAMQMQMETLKERHKAEVSELHHLLQASNCSVPLRNRNDRSNHGENPALESLEIEYLKNILFEYMMGRETLTLAKVIAAVVRFSDEQLVKILEKEEARISGQT